MFKCSDNPKPHLFIIDPGVTPGIEVAYHCDELRLGTLCYSAAMLVPG